jgi:tetratricopeptide (TPR) repeat protein
MTEHWFSGILVAFLLILAALWSSRRWVEMVSEQLLSPWELALGVVLFAAYLGLVLKVWGTVWGYPLVLLFFLLLSLQDPLRRYFHRQRQRAWVERDLQRCRELVEFDPRNHGAYEEMARLYEAMEDYDRAIEAIQQALQLAPHYPSYQYTLRRLVEKKQRLFFPCPSCGVEVRRGTRRCSACGQRVGRAS